MHVYMISSDYGLSSVWSQAITWTIAHLLWTGSWGTTASSGLEIPDRPVANAMRNGEGLQLIPNTVARLAIIFFATWYVKIACFHDINRCWKWPASRRLDANWFSFCVAWMNGFRAQGTGLRYYGMCKYRACDWPAWDARLLSVLDIKLKVTINKPFFKAAWTNYTNVPPECLG